MYRQLLRPALFRLGGGDAEVAHTATLRALAGLGGGSARLTALWAATARYRKHARATPVELFGLRFPNPVGLAAGLDKDGIALPAWPALGFGFVEVGTVTRYPQPGNPRPRLFRLPASEALINRMGFNNAGAAALASRLATLGRLPVPLGVSIGKSKVTPLSAAVEDYLVSLRTLYAHGDYFAINVSSPNTPGLRTLQDAGALTELLTALSAESRLLAAGGPPRPLLVKVSPDLTEPALAELLQVCTDAGVAGVIATNTTLARDGLAGTDSATGAEPGGLSGRPLHERAVRLVRFVHGETGGRLPVIGVGGILDAHGALRMLDAGASLVQLYTGFIYRGPELVRQINRAVGQTVYRPRVPATSSQEPR
ncbi:dihydroorotate dehydrogenase (quinone) [Actinocatenispora thailandica]|uniref:Dihydroorotate dehydrogenase (quinone) n=2 Tax=Actinocatenispora thailandica TaxID=227318 RepID=A0A7R7DP31_9ACTN|nr:dihydroorotate dehydrogenase (quinone) [Actinocatenispora thailandica]